MQFTNWKCLDEKSSREFQAYLNVDPFFLGTWSLEGYMSCCSSMPLSCCFIFKFFSHNCDYSLILYQNSTSYSFLKTSYGIKSENISINFSSLLYWNPLVYFSLWMDFVTLCSGHLENIYSLFYSFSKSWYIFIFHYRYF